MFPPKKMVHDETKKRTIRKQGDIEVFFNPTCEEDLKIDMK